MYNIYHIPGKKIGVTRNLISRVTEQQGYAPDEYEVLHTSEDINEISLLEIELQKSYGYRVDRQLYKDLHCNKFNQMNVNVTKQTVTFPIPLNKLKGHLMDNIGLQWITPDDGDVDLTLNLIPWMVQNARTSMYNANRCYIYNKSLKEFIESESKQPAKDSLIETAPVIGQFQLIREWAENRGLYSKGDAKTQYIKLQEEAGELAQAILKDDQPEVIDAIGDMVVVLTNLAHFRGVSIEHCIESAYNVINKRKGSMVNGTFVKETL